MWTVYFSLLLTVFCVKSPTRPIVCKPFKREGCSGTPFLVCFVIVLFALEFLSRSLFSIRVWCFPLPGLAAKVVLKAQRRCSPYSRGVKAIPSEYTLQCLSAFAPSYSLQRLSAFAPSDYSTGDTFRALKN